MFSDTKSVKKKSFTQNLKLNLNKSKCHKLNDNNSNYIKTKVNNSIM